MGLLIANNGFFLELGFNSCLFVKSLVISKIHRTGRRDGFYVIIGLVIRKLFNGSEGLSPYYYY